MSNLERVTAIVVRAKMLRASGVSTRVLIANLSQWDAQDCVNCTYSPGAATRITHWEMLLDEITSA